ncbi:hypothetical protein [Sinorhizobium meliloti]|uniref:hypothetical protein n=1 Tax=Rhizobium meliloti TaxID=382 RepID=UPI000FD939F6|nr:hypothetical protein [Sinorhizobium meliloti]RVQ20395.1 hypothetical protein CN096_06750 [Sinorhizobium meliloti]
MADLVLTPSAIIAGSNSAQEHGTAGEPITAGKVVYKSATTKKWMLADSNSATTAARQAGAIALSGASDGQPITVHKSGDLTVDAVLTAGQAVYLSDTAGGLCPLADVGAGEYVCLIGLAKSTTVLAVDIQFPNVSL